MTGQHETGIMLLSNTNHANNLLAGLYRQYNEGQNCDLELRFGSKEKSIFAHKCLVNMYLQKVGPDIDIGGFFLDMSKYKSSVISCLVESIYTGILQVSRSNINEVLSAALALGHMDVVNACRSYMEKNPGELTCPDVEKPEKVLCKSEPVDDGYLNAWSPFEHAKKALKDSSVVTTSTGSYTIEGDINKLVTSAKDTSETAGGRGRRVKGVEYPSSDHYDTLSSHPNEGSVSFVTTTKGCFMVEGSVKDWCANNKLAENSDVCGTDERNTRPKQRGPGPPCRGPPSIPCRTKVTKVLVLNKNERTKLEGVSSALPGPRPSGKTFTRKNAFKAKNVLGKMKAKRQLKKDLSAKALATKTVKVKQETVSSHECDQETQASFDENDDQSVEEPDSHEVYFDRDESHVNRSIEENDSQINDKEEDENESKEGRLAQSDETQDKEEGTSTIDMDKTFWNTVKTLETPTKSDILSDSERETSLDSQMLSLGMKRKSKQDSSSQVDSSEKSGGRRLRKKKKVNYSLMDGDYDESIDEELVQYPIEQCSSADDYFRMIKSDQGTIYVEEKEEKTNDKQYFPPAAIVPEGCYSRYAQGIVANRRIVTKSTCDVKGNTWVETKICPERRTIFQNGGKKTKRPEGEGTATFYICHPTRPVVRGPFNHKQKTPRINRESQDNEYK